MQIEALVRKKATAAQRMIRCIVELTPLCNLSCEMCGISLKADEVPRYGRILRTEEWRGLIDQLHAYGVLYLVFSGGEPLLYPGFRELYAYAYSKGFIIEIRTNGLLIPKYQDLFREMPPRQIGISVYGSSDDMYRRMTGVNDGFTRLTEALQIVSTLKCQRHLTCTMTKTNVSCFLDAARLAEKYKATFGMITDIFPHVKGCRQNTDTRLSPAECAALAAFPPVDYQLALDTAHALERDHAGAFSLELQAEEKPLAMCLSCQINACIKWDGRMTFCPQIETVYAQPLETGVEEAWEQLMAARPQCTAPNAQCTACGLRAHCQGACPARFWLETGSFRQPCRTACERAYYAKLLASLKGNRK